MPREGYQQQLEELRGDVLYMSEVVFEQLRTGLSALNDKDEGMAWEVIEGDHEINEMYLELEQECVDLLALQQPIAGDLRFIAASFKIITDLERIADLAANLGDYTLEAERDVFPDVDIQDIGTEVIRMVEDAMDAYAAENPEACYAVAEYDDEVDAHCERASETVARELIKREGVDDEEEIERLIQDVYRLLLTIRELERVGDHAVNIAARTLYMVKSDDDLLY